MSGSEEVMSLTDSKWNESLWIKVLWTTHVAIVQLYTNEPWAHTSKKTKIAKKTDMVSFLLFCRQDSKANNCRASGVTAEYYPATPGALLSEVTTRYAVKSRFKFERNSVKWLGGRRREINSSLTASLWLKWLRATHQTSQIENNVANWFLLL